MLNCCRCPLNVHVEHPYRDCDRRLLETSYKFYLSFENSLCDDYVTEKFFRVSRLDVVPVVLGVADYTQWMPPGTFVDVREFRSPKQLADFLRRLDGDDEAYMEILRRKRQMICRPFDWCIGDYRDRICSYLHKTYDMDQQVNLRHIIDPRIACVRPQDFYRNISNLTF
jgi:Glycosyltransferase family 10 (fucosyltransferase) C-term